MGENFDVDNSYVCREDGKERNLMDPFMDWPFKYIFAREENKENLILFLKLLLGDDVDIVDLEYLNNELIPEEEQMKGCVFDIICRNKNGDKFLVEMQKRQGSNFNDRILYYACSLVTKMGKKGRGWNYGDIKQVYSICLMNFKLGENPRLRRDFGVYDRFDGQLFSDKLNIILLQIPCLTAESINDCTENYEFLLYLLKQMHLDMKTIEQLKQEVRDTHLPFEIKEVFYNVLDTADVASLSERDRERYEANLKFYRDTMWQLNDMKAEAIAEGRVEGLEQGRAEGLEQGRTEGRAEGRAEGMEVRTVEIASSMKLEGASAEFISKVTGLSVEEIQNL